MLSSTAGYLALTESVAAAEQRRDVIVATGADTITFLQSQLSQDLVAMGVGESRWSLHLTPQGKPIAFVRVHRVGPDPARPEEADPKSVEQVQIDVDAGFGRAVVTALSRFRIRTKCDLTLHEDVLFLAVRGPDSGRVTDESGLAAAWPNWPGFDLVGPPIGALASDGAASAWAERIGLDLVDPEVFEATRIERGVPRSGSEIDESVIPAETGVVPIAVNFKKGCYVGQELVERIDSRGHVNRHLRGLDLRGSAVPPSGAEVVDARAKVIGRLTSAAIHPVLGTTVALGYVRREVEPGTEVVIRWASGTDDARVRALPPLA